MTLPTTSRPSVVFSNPFLLPGALNIMMLAYYRHDVRTTLTLDDDVAAGLHHETRRSAPSFKETVNHYLRLGLNAPAGTKRRAFVVHARALGLRQSLTYDSASDLLDQIEGSRHH